MKNNKIGIGRELKMNEKEFDFMLQEGEALRLEFKESFDNNFIELNGINDREKSAEVIKLSENVALIMHQLDKLNPQVYFNNNNSNYINIFENENIENSILEVIL